MRHQRENEVADKKTQQTLSPSNRKISIAKNKNHLIFDRNLIIQQLLKIVESKLNNFGESALASGIGW